MKSKISSALLILGGLMSPPPIPHDPSTNEYFRASSKPRKGQIRNARPKRSNAAALKRAAKKRNNIRKHN